jgi:hypothetical protein
MGTVYISLFSAVMPVLCEALRARKPGNVAMQSCLLQLREKGGSFYILPELSNCFCPPTKPGLPQSAFPTRKSPAENSSLLYIDKRYNIVKYDKVIWK